MIRSSALLALASSLLLLASVAQAFFVLPSASSAAACARTSQRVISAVRMQGAKDKEEKAADEQEIKDLTLEDMFDVFEAADKSQPDEGKGGDNPFDALQNLFGGGKK